MFRFAVAATLVMLAALSCATPAAAETLRCQSVNGNVNCAGSDGVACQTVNGKKTCVSGHGDVVQSFGKGTSTNSSARDSDDGTDTDDDGLANTSHSQRTRSQHR